MCWAGPFPEDVHREPALVKDGRKGRLEFACKERSGADELSWIPCWKRLAAIGHIPDTAVFLHQDQWAFGYGAWAGEHVWLVAMH